MRTKSKSLLSGLGLAALCLSCRVEPVPDVREPGRADVVFTVEDADGPTRATGPVAADEMRVERWALYLYQSGVAAPIAVELSPTGAPISLSVTVGTYTAYAVVNYTPDGPGAFTPASLTEAALRGHVSYLADNGAASLVMFGGTTLTFPEGPAGTQRIPVSRLAAKLGIRKISVDLDAFPDLAAQPFTLKGIYVTNACRESRFGADLTAAELPAARSGWYNAMGWHASGSCTSPACPDALLGDTGLNAVLSPQAPYTTAHTFYVYPNPVTAGADSRAASWSRRCTRLVIEAQIGGRTWYYPITPATETGGIRRNCAYIIEEAVIRRVGAADPEGNAEGAVEVTWATGQIPWGEVSVTEES